MAPFQRRYSSLQDEAILHAQLDLGMSAAAAARAAAAGELPVPGKPGARMPAFTMPAATARDKAGVERRRRKTMEVRAGGTGDELADLVARLLVMARREVERVERSPRQGSKAGDIRLAAAAVKEVMDLSARLAKMPRESAPAPAEGAGGKGFKGDDDDWIGALAAGGI